MFNPIADLLREGHDISEACRLHCVEMEKGKAKMEHTLREVLATPVGEHNTVERLHSDGSLRCNDCGEVAKSENELRAVMCRPRRPSGWGNTVSRYIRP